jgi:hypothetical protein
LAKQTKNFKIETRFVLLPFSGGQKNRINILGAPVKDKGKEF